MKKRFLLIPLIVGMSAFASKASEKITNEDFTQSATAPSIISVDYGDGMLISATFYATAATTADTCDNAALAAYTTASLQASAVAQSKIPTVAGMCNSGPM